MVLSAIGRTISILLSCLVLAALLSSCKEPTQPTTVERQSPMESNEAAKARAGKIKGPAQFESSAFCKAANCQLDSAWQLASGGDTFNYKTNISEGMVDAETRNNELEGLGLTYLNGHQLTDDDYKEIELLVQASDPKRDHATTMRFIRAHIKDVMCNDCSVPRDATHIQDGDFRVAAGIAGGPVVTLQRVLPASQ